MRAAAIGFLYKAKRDSVTYVTESEDVKKNLGK